MAKVTIIEQGKYAGIWVESDQGQIGLCAIDGQGPYICFHDEKAKGLPMLAIGVDKDGEDVTVQVPGEPNTVRNGKRISIKDLAALVAAPAVGGIQVPTTTTKEIPD